MMTQKGPKNLHHDDDDDDDDDNNNNNNNMQTMCILLDWY